MAQFDIHRVGRGDLIIDCQSDLLSDFNTRFVVPLTLRQGGAPPASRLNPIFTVAGREYVMRTQFASTVERRLLGEVVASLDDHSFEIVGAIDMLIAGV